MKMLKHKTPHGEVLPPEEVVIRGGRPLTDKEARARIAAMIAKDPTYYSALRGLRATADRLRGTR
jgi:hypothetical protein